MDHGLDKKKEYHYQQTEHKDYIFDWGHFLSVYLTIAFGLFIPKLSDFQVCRRYKEDVVPL